MYREHGANFDWEKIDIFSLGICLLSFAVKKDPFEFYDFIDNEVKMDKIMYEIEELKQKGFSKKFRFFLASCLKPDPSKRANLGELFSIHKNKSLQSMNSLKFW